MSLRRRSISSRAGTAGDLSSLLARVATGDLSPDAAASQLAPLLVSGGAQAEDVGGFAKIDHDRRRRVGFPEVVFGDGKSAEQIMDILTAMIRDAGREGSTEAADTAGDGGSPIVATRVSPEKWSVLSEGLPGQLTYHVDARIVSFAAPTALGGAAGGQAGDGSAKRSIGKVAVLSAGTSDLAIAEEAAVLAELSGAEVRGGKNKSIPGYNLFGVSEKFIPQASSSYLCTVSIPSEGVPLASNRRVASTPVVCSSL